MLASSMLLSIDLPLRLEHSFGCMEPEEIERLEPLPRAFYQPSARVVAPRLLGHWLVRRHPLGLAASRIVETEAYIKDDPACHAYGGLTNRNRAMWGEPGRSYVYLIYGFYFCFNTVCRPPGDAEAVLVRAVDVAVGRDWLLANRPVPREHQLTSGPGKLCAALRIDRGLDAVDLCDPASPIFICRNPAFRSYRRQLGPVVTTTRIGLTQAADWPLRYYLDGSPYVSKRRRRPKARAEAGS